jgi:hypothetical protein
MVGNSYRVAQPSVSHQQEGIGKGEEGVLICDYRVLTEIAYDEQLICKEKSVSELNV